MQQLVDWMRAATIPGPFSPPGLVVAINGATIVTGVDGAGVPLTPDAIWPITCLTKLVLADVAVQTLPLDATITTWLPEVESPATVWALLTHTAGLPLDLPGDHYGRVTADDVRTITLGMRPTHFDGTMAYSNIGYGWIALALERATGQHLAELWAGYDLLSGADVTNAVTIADVRSPYADTDFEPINSAYWRSLELPWAGAFGTVEAISGILTRLDPRVSASTVSAAGGFPKGAYFGFVENDGCVWDDSAWSCGAELRGTKSPHWITAKASPRSFGHVGSSGMLAWKDECTTLVLAGPRTTDGGWILRQGPRGSAFAFRGSAYLQTASAH